MPRMPNATCQAVRAPLCGAAVRRTLVLSFLTMGDFEDIYAESGTHDDAGDFLGGDEKSSGKQDDDIFGAIGGTEDGSAAGGGGGGGDSAGGNDDDDDDDDDDGVDISFSEAPSGNNARSSGPVPVSKHPLLVVVFISQLNCRPGRSGSFCWTERGYSRHGSSRSSSRSRDRCKTGRADKYQPRWGRGWGRRAISCERWSGNHGQPIVSRDAAQCVRL